MRSAHRGTAITLSWTRPADVVRSVVIRAPGLKGKQPSVVYDGKANTHVDRKITPGARYRYEVRLYDQAGNLAATTVGLKPGAGIFSPVEGEVVKRPPVVNWAKVPKARFYNVQLWRGDVKLLTIVAAVTEAGASPVLDVWREEATVAPRALPAPIWPAFGTVKAPRYGKAVGQVTFVVRR